MIIDPFKFAPLWTPDDIETALWLDAADEDTITESGGAVSQWDDKSGKTRHFTQGTGSNQPTTGSRTQGGLNVIDFNGSSDFMDSNSGFVDQEAAWHAFFVSQFDISGGTNKVFLQTQDATGTGRSIFYIGLSPEDFTTFISGSRSNYFAYTASVMNTSFKWSSGGSSNDHESWLDGTSQGTFSVNNGANTNAVLRLGAVKTVANYFDGFIAEFILLGSVASDATRQKIEGYLAWKWGLVANLPSGHQYKSNPPREF